MQLNITLEDTAEAEAKLGAGIDKALRLTFYDLAENVVVGGRFSPGTPVDTGFARRSWWIGVNNPGEPHQPARPGEGDAGGGLQPFITPEAVLGGKAGDLFYLSTNCAYMEALEYGHSRTQAPHGMLRLAVAGAQAMFDQNVRDLAAGLA